jgi:hypothetical protein
MRGAVEAGCRDVRVTVPFSSVSLSAEQISPEVEVDFQCSLLAKISIIIKVIEIRDRLLELFGNGLLVGRSLTVRNDLDRQQAVGSITQDDLGRKSGTETVCSREWGSLHSRSFQPTSGNLPSFVAREEDVA